MCTDTIFHKSHQHNCDSNGSDLINKFLQFISRFFLKGQNNNKNLAAANPFLLLPIRPAISPPFRSALRHTGEAPPPSTRLEGDLVTTAARRHGGGQRPHRHARGPHGKYIIFLLPYGPRSQTDPLTMDLSVFAAHQPGHRAAVRHLHPCHHGVGEVHLRPRDVPAEQRRHHRHGHAYAAAPTPHHRRLRPHEPKRQDPSAQRCPDLPLARMSRTLPALPWHI
jgi:hypothetical protein